MRPLFPAVVLPLALMGCQAAEKPSAGPTAAAASAVPGDITEAAPYDGIKPDETVHFTGTEPFWGGQVRGTALMYSTPENPDGSAIPVVRFAGRGGVSWSGTWQEKPFRLAVTEGTCSDGMSDRSYPFTATLEVAGEQRNGCAWSDRRGVTPEEQGTPPQG
jgi:uncharacterized membrane protein